jgi:cyclase
MRTLRIIPCLDVAGGRVVKGVSFLDLTDAGDPVELARRYDLEGADELVLLDISASHEDRGPMVDVAARVAEEIAIPFAVGGGIDRVASVGALLRVGVDKVSVNSAVVARPTLIREIADEFGSQCVVVAIDVRRVPGGFEVVTHGGRRPTGIELARWLARVQEEGAGEVLVTSMDADGHQRGYDKELMELVVAETSVPVIASGGVGGLEDFAIGAAVGVQGLLAASVFHFGKLTVGEVKAYLAGRGYRVRYGGTGQHTSASPGQAGDHDAG